MRHGTGSLSRSAFACSLALALAGCGSSGRGATTPAKAKSAAPTVRVVLTAQSHHPRVGKPWHYEVRVANARGQPVAALVHLQILLNGSPVGQIGRHRVRGLWQETIGAGGNTPFPAAARGQPLVFEAIVTADGKTVKRDWPISVR